MAQSNDKWNPDQYERFRNERSQPFFDLLALVRPHPSMRVVDLGCGTGDMTRVLHETLKASDTLGLDASAAMLAKSESYAGDGLHFERRDIAEFSAEGEYDLVFSNAALHRLPDHESLLARLTRALKPGGQIAIQMPANDDYPTHVVAARLARQSPFCEAMQGWERQWPVLKPEAYATLLNRLGYATQHVRLQVYGHLLDARDGVIEWVKGTLLTDYEKHLSAELFAQFMQAYRKQLFEQLEDTHPFFLTYKRILFWAQR
jgi:trans-aconitate 2-methyltransferase